MVIVVLNGTQVICRTNILGPTGGALDSYEEKPGPIMLQGDHGPVEYRNIVLTTARLDAQTDGTCVPASDAAGRLDLRYEQTPTVRTQYYFRKSSRGLQACRRRAASVAR